MKPEELADSLSCRYHRHVDLGRSLHHRLLPLGETRGVQDYPPATYATATLDTSERSIGLGLLHRLCQLDGVRRELASATSIVQQECSNPLTPGPSH